MIPRYQRITFWVLIALIVGMATFLFVQRQRARDRVNSLADDTPIDAPYTVSESITLALANDADGSVLPADRRMALPTETTARARALIDHLMAEYTLPGSAHPLQGGAVVEDVFLVALPLTGRSLDANATPMPNAPTPTVPVRSSDADALQPLSPGGQLAVVNLRSSFVNAHPTGIEVETLTLRSILATLNANLPQIEQVRFLVDGQSRPTLAGHADLGRIYPTANTADTPPVHR